ncbi:MAG: hypothetical protein E7540_05410 [Ruminococcaceae bacterium]|nr:hypothetical protein [Oscillospiraceae bacterium]
MENFRETLTIDLSQIFRQILRKWFWVAIAGILAATFSYCYAEYYVTPVYRATSVMLVELRESNIEELDSEKVTIAQKYVSTFADIIRTNYVLEDVIEDLGLQGKETPSSLFSRIKVYVADETFLIKVTFDHPDKQKAQEYLTAIDNSVVEKVKEKFGSDFVKEWDPPTVSNGPVYPSVSRYTAVGGMIGVVVSLSLIILIALLNNKVKSVADLQRIEDLPILGVVPSLDAIEKNKK